VDPLELQKEDPTKILLLAWIWLSLPVSGSFTRMDRVAGLGGVPAKIPPTPLGTTKRMITYQQEISDERKK